MCYYMSKAIATVGSGAYDITDEEINEEINGEIIFSETDQKLLKVRGDFVFSDNELEEILEKRVSGGERALFEEFSGSIDRIIDLKAERLEALDEKYYGFDWK